MTDVRVRPGDPQERELLEALQWRASLTSDEDRSHLLAHPEEIRLPTEQLREGRVLVAVEDGTIIGFAVVLGREDGGAELDGLFVEPARWRSGVGRRLVQAVLAKAAGEGARQLHVLANPAALAFYTAAGFVAEGEVQMRFGRAIVMRIAVAAP